MADPSALEHLLPLVGRWHGRALVTSPGRAPLELYHREHVQARNAGALVTIEGTSLRNETDTEPAFTALAVVYADTDGVHWHAYSHGAFWPTTCELSAGRYVWSAPGPPPTRYVAEFDERHWRETGYLTSDEQVTVFDMQLTPVPD